MKKTAFPCPNPNCNVILEVSPDKIGEKYKCPKCSQYGIVPNPNGTIPSNQIKDPIPAPPEPQNSLGIKVPDSLPATTNESFCHKQKGNFFMDFMSFKIMITPVLIKIVFWIFFIITALTIIALVFPEGRSATGNSMQEDLMYRLYLIPNFAFLIKIIAVLTGFMIVRILCEFMIVLFCIEGKISNLKKNS